MSIKCIFETLSINNTQHAECHYAKRRDLFIVMLNVVMLRVVMLSVIMLSVVMQSVIMLVLLC
jgi:hypothetical protein